MARGTRRSGGRPRYQWIRKNQVSTEFANGASAQLLGITDAEILAEALAAPTLVRVRGELLLTLDPATTSADEAQIVTLGIIVVPSTVVASEIGGPGSFPNLEWMWWNTVCLNAPTVITTSGVNVEAGFARVPFDVKAMRKIHKSAVRLIVELTGGDAHVFVCGGWSCLFQE